MDLDVSINNIFTSPVVIVGFLFFFLVIFPFIFLFAGPVMKMRLAKALREGGTPTNGRVTKLKHEVKPNVRTKAPVDFYSVVYEFEVGGQKYSSEQYVRAEVYRTLREGSLAGVTYLPANPAKSMLSSTL